MASTTSNKQMKATVCILTFDCGEEINALISKIKNQKFNGEFEILIIDSSIKEESRKIIEEIKGIRLIKISNKDFGHGRTRNMAIKEAIGEFVVLLTQDALPYNDLWLQEITDPFSISKDILCVFGNQIPYEDCNPLMRYKITSTFENISKKEIVIHSKEDKDKTGTYFNSNVNAAYRKSAFPKQIAFKDINYAEDQDIAKQIIDKGFKKAYNPNAKVYHSHNWKSPWEYFQRYFDEYRGLKQSIGYEDKSLIVFKIFFRTFKAWMLDVRSILFRSKAGIFSKIVWCVKSYLIENYRFEAMFLGPRFEKIPQKYQNLFSREDMQRNLKVNNLSFFGKLKGQLLLYYYLQFRFYLNHS